MNFPRCFKRFSGQQTSGRRSQCRRARLAVEALESRVTPSSVLLGFGHLLIKPDAAESVTIGVNNSGGVLVTLYSGFPVTSQVFPFARGQVSSIEVDTASGGAVIGVLATPASVSLTINSVGTEFDGDQVSLGSDVSASPNGALPVAGGISNILGPVTVNGNGDPKVYVSNESDTPADPMTITSDSVSRAGFGGLTYSGLAFLGFDQPAGPATYNVNGTAAGTGYQWGGLAFSPNPLSGPYSFNFGTGNLDALQGPITVLGDTVNATYQDEASSADRNYTFNEGTFSDGPAGFKVNIESGKGSITIDGSSGNDSYDVLPNDNALSSFASMPLTLHGGGGRNRLTLNDPVEFGAEYSVGPGFVRAVYTNGHKNPHLWTTVTVGDSGFQSLTLNGSELLFGSDFYVSNIPNGTAVTFNAGGGVTSVFVGDDSHSLGDIQGALTVSDSGFSSSATVTLEDQANTAGRGFLVSNGQVSFGLGQVDLSGSGVQNLVLDGSSGTNSFVFLDTPAGLTATINAGPNGDTVQAGGSLTGDAGNVLGPLVINGQGNTTFTDFDQSDSTPQTYTLTGASTGGVISQSDGLAVTCNNLQDVTVNGSSGGNSLLINDQNASEAEDYTLGSGSFVREDSNGVKVAYAGGIQAVTVNGSNAGSNFDVSSLANGTDATFNSGTGVNTVSAGNSSGGVAAIQGTLTVSGASSGSTTLTLDDTANRRGRTFQVTNGQVTFGLGQVNFAAIQGLVLDGGARHNTFVLLSTPAGLTTTVNTGPNADTVQTGDDQVGLGSLLGPIVVNGPVDANIRFTADDQSATTSETYTLTGMPTGGEVFSRNGVPIATCGRLLSLTVNGGSGGNQFQEQTATSLVIFNGGSGTNSLSATEGVGHHTNWVITGPGSGQVGRRLTFTGMHDLLGTTNVDNFELLPGGSIAGTIKGGTGLGNILSYAKETGPVTVNLQTGAAPQVAGGARGGISGITLVQGSTSSANTLIGPDADTTWNISAVNGGSGIAGKFAFGFSQFQNLLGGAGADVFQFTAAGSLAGSLNGGGAPAHEGNWLDYSAIGTKVAVNLQTGSATGVAKGAAGKVTNIQNVHGGSGPNFLTGDSQGNILVGGAGSDVITGGSGASLLIGDGGSDQVTGGSGKDILIGDTTIYDFMDRIDEAALMSILAEWQSTDSYATRFHDINTGTGGGLNGAAKLNFGTTVKDDGAADKVTAAPSAQALNWFFRGTGDTLVNVQNGEHINNT